MSFWRSPVSRHVWVDGRNSWLKASRKSTSQLPTTGSLGSIRSQNSHSDHQPSHHAIADLVASAGAGSRSESKRRSILRRSQTRSSALVTTMRVADGCAKFPALARWSPPQPWPASATELLFAGDVSSRPGLGWCHGYTPPGQSEAVWHQQARQHLSASQVDHGARAVLLRVTRS